MQEILEEALQLSPIEQLELIRGLSESLQSQVEEAIGQSSVDDKIPVSVKRTKPATNLADYEADFWPDDESIDDFNAFIQQQRDADRLSDQ
jgi:hypothetical protein